MGPLHDNLRARSQLHWRFLFKTHPPTHTHTLVDSQLRLHCIYTKRIDETLGRKLSAPVFFCFCLFIFASSRRRREHWGTLRPCIFCFLFVNGSSPDVRRDKRASRTRTTKANDNSPIEQNTEFWNERNSTPSWRTTRKNKTVITSHHCR